MVDGEEPQAGLFPESVGGRLQAMRLSAKLDLNDIGTRTRIPTRHLDAIERSDYAALPSFTYALGFTRAYARALGADEDALSRDLRIELGRQPSSNAGAAMPYEPADPSRVPSKLLAWTAAAIALLLAIGYGVWRSAFFGNDPVAAINPVPAPAHKAPVRPKSPPTAMGSGQVVLTAIAPVWVRVYDASRKNLLQKELAAGERFVVPPDADHPMILTGRPDNIRVAVDGREVETLGPAQKTVKDVEISAAALAARRSLATIPPVAAQ